MACYDRVSCSVDPTTGALTVNTKNGSCTIEPGDTVTFTETEVGYIISINGEPNIIPKPDEDDYGDNVSFTETDDSYIITINNEPNVIPKNCLQLIDCNGDYIDPCVDRVVTCENLQEAIDDLPEPPAQTQVVRGTGGRQATQTLTARHFGTYPNETWRETWMERNGDIVTVHSWNPIENEWDSLSVESAEDLVVLNNPVIYLRTNGSPNPPIETQADLTPANAFDSFDAIRNFLRRTLLVGTVTVDGQGDFSAPGFSSAGQVAASTFKNAANIVVRGSPDNAQAFILPFGGLQGRVTGLACPDGNVTVRDLTFRCVNEAEASYTSFAAGVNAQGGNISFAGTVRFDGYYDNDRVGRTAQVFLLRSVVSGNISIGNNTVVVFDFDAGTSISSLGLIGPQAVLEIAGNVIFNIQNGCELRAAQFDVDSSAYLRFVLSVANPDPLAVTGGSRFISSNTARIADLGIVSAGASYGTRPQLIAYDFGTDEAPGGPQATMLVRPLSVVNSVAGP